jgi:ornithine cyclodeaminase/alanine dehydrogenase-like protein (mu-crystallin family)
MPLKVLDAEATAAALPWAGLIDALRDMLARRRAGCTQSPERLAVPLSGGILLAMPATDGEYASTKLVTVCAGNAARGLPTLLGEVLLMRADTGERLLMLDGPTVTARRTAAMSALAAIELGAASLAAPGSAPAGSGENGPSMLIVGSGVQARGHLEVFTQALGVKRVRVSSRNPANARAFAERARVDGVDCEAVENPAQALREADIVVTGTTSLAPLFDDDPVFGGFVAAVGAFRPEMCELPPALVRRGRLYIDDKPGGLHEAGDFIQAKVDWARVTALEDAIAANDRPAGGPVVFKSVGQALWDLAACRLAVERLGGGE